MVHINLFFLIKKEQSSSNPYVWIHVRVQGILSDESNQSLQSALVIEAIPVSCYEGELTAHIIFILRHPWGRCVTVLLLRCQAFSFVLIIFCSVALCVGFGRTKLFP